MYDTSREALAAVTDAGKIPILDVDVAGARAIKAQMPNGAFVFVVPASVDALEERLRAAEVGEDGAPRGSPRGGRRRGARGDGREDRRAVG